MKGAAFVSTIVAIALEVSAESFQKPLEERKITEVVRLLENMLDKSKADGDAERTLWGKYKCYYDTNKASKAALVEKLTEEINVLDAKIEGLLATNSQLSKDVAKLDADMLQNQKDREVATQIRDTEHKEFVAKDIDLKQAIDQCAQAIKTLAEVGADQTLNTAQGHSQYMADFKPSALLKLKTSLKTALLAASAFASKKQVDVVEVLLQEPFTGTYSARSGEVVGILKDMKDTFSANSVAAKELDVRAASAFNKYMKEMLDSYNSMKEAHKRKQAELSTKDEDLSSKRKQKVAAENTKTEAEDFLAKLREMYAAKNKQYTERVALRTQEEAAMAEAIAILNSDAAFATFGKVSATSTGMQFFQRHSTVRRHGAMSPRVERDDAEPLHKAMGFLQAAQGVGSGSAMIGRVIAMIQANNPFKVVLEEIEKMISLIEKEGAADVDQKEWCDKERQEANSGISLAIQAIEELTAAIGELTTTIHDPVSGLLVQIEGSEMALQENQKNQVDETKSRRADNDAYQKDVATLQDAQALLKQAIKVLTRYYSKITGSVLSDLAQVSKGTPTPPETWEEKYQGQSKAGGTTAIEMLKFILGNTKKEEQQAHTDESQAQRAYEDLMQSLKNSEVQLQESLVDLKEQLAEAEEQLQLKKDDLAKTEEEKAALEAYLLKIKPGCDFISTNLENRDHARTEEKSALASASNFLKGTPVYRQYYKEQHKEGLGECLEICEKSGEDHVNCKACLAHTTVPGYCAGHAGTRGC